MNNTGNLSRGRLAWTKAWRLALKAMGFALLLRVAGLLLSSFLFPQRFTVLTGLPVAGLEGLTELTLGKVFPVWLLLVVLVIGIAAALVGAIDGLVNRDRDACQ